MAHQHSIAQLHAITQSIDGVTHAGLAEAACRGGVRWVQLRVKNATDEEWRRNAAETLEVCVRYGAVCIINDNPILARELGADGVHLGREDMPPAEARSILGPDAIVGGTANTFDDIMRLADAGVNYIGLGPFRFTTTKERLSPILGIEGYRTILDRCRQAGIDIPIIAIGGITAGDISPLLQTGVHGIAISSAINRAPDPAQAAARFLNELHAVQTA